MKLIELLLWLLLWLSEECDSQFVLEILLMIIHWIQLNSMHPGLVRLKYHRYTQIQACNHAVSTYIVTYDQY